MALYASTYLSADVVAREDAGDAERVQLHTPSVLVGALVMSLLRASVGFVLFLMAFWLRGEDAGTAWFGLALSLAAIGTVIGNASARFIRSHLSEESMLVAALVLASLSGVLAAVVGTIPALMGLAFGVNLAGSIGRLGFEAMLQRDAPQANRGRAFANFETRFQLSWAAAGLIPVVIEMSGRIGALVVAVACVGGLAYHVILPRVTTRTRWSRFGGSGDVTGPVHHDPN